MPARAKSRPKAMAKSKVVVDRRSARPRGGGRVLEGSEALRAFQDSGCLFLVNLVKLHTTGHVMRFDRRGDEVVPMWIDMTDHPEECVFTDDEMEMGLAKLKEFAAEMDAAIRLRRRRLGYSRQPVPGDTPIRRDRVG